MLLGVRFDVTTWYFLFDIDRRSEYHPARSHASYTSLLHAMEEAGFTRYLVVSSSESGGVHVYFFLPEAVSTDALAVAVDERLRENGFGIGDGRLEVFPNVKGGADSLYKAHRLPLQRGSYVLDPVTFEPRHQDISAFLHEASLDAEGQDSEAIRELLAHAKAKRGRSGAKTAASFSTEGNSLRAHLVECMEEGWTDYGQTNHKLWKIAMYGRVVLRLEGEALTSYIVSTAKASPGYRDFCRHQHEIERKARDWTRFAMKHYYPYGSRWVERDTTYWRRDWQHTALGIGILPDVRTPQEQTHNETLARVQYVVEQLRKEGELPKTVTKRVGVIRKKVRELFGGGASLETLYKEEYRAVWHPSNDKRIPMIPDPWTEPLETSGVTASKPDVERHYATLPNKVIYALAPVREECVAQAGEESAEGDCEEIFIKPEERAERPQATNHHTTSSTSKSHKPCLSSYSEANPAPTDKPSLSVEPRRAHILPGSWCRVVGYVRDLAKGSRVLVDVVDPGGQTVTVLTRRGVALSGIPPNCLEPSGSP